MFRILPCILILLAASAGMASQQMLSRVIVVPEAKRAILLDGRLNEPAWKTAGRIGSFVSYRKTGRPANQTEVHLLYDKRALYLGFRCWEKDMGHIRAATTEHDGSVWDDDAVEIFLDTKGDRAGFTQFIMNTVGTKYDGLGNDSYGFNPKWEGKAVMGKDGWTAEISIPFSELGAQTPTPGDSWLGSFCRDEQPSGELSSWCIVTGSFSSTASFGEIIFGTFAAKTSRILAGADQALTEMSRSAKALHVDASDALTDALDRLQAARSLFSKSASLSESDYLRIQSMLRGNRQGLSKVGDMIRRAQMGNPEYLVWETTPWRHFAMREDTSAVRADAKLVDAVVLAGQTESKAIMVTNLTNETLSARLLLTGFPKDSAEMLIPAFVRCADGSAFPDALVPPDPIGQLVVPAGETRQIWLNIKGTQSGKFEGTLKISPLTASKTDKSVKFTVETIQPPSKPLAPLAFTWDYLGDAEARGLEKEYVRTMLDHGIRVFMITGLRYMPRPRADDEGRLLEPTDWNDFERAVGLKWRPGTKLYITCDVWEKAAERKIFNGKFDSPGWRIAFKEIIVEMAAELKKLGLSYEDYMVNPLDESIDERYIAIARLIKEADPRIEIVEDTVGQSIEQVKEADKYTDYWIPHFKAYFADGSRASIDYMRSSGKPLGFYFYSEGADEKAQDSYHHYLWDFWYAYSRDLNGVFGYWTATQHYGDPWNRHQTTAAYDPSLFYPGNGCVITGRRWEAWRRGLEDFALLRLCESSGVDKGIISEAVKSVLDSPRDPLVADRARERLVRALRGAR